MDYSLLLAVLVLGVAAALVLLLVEMLVLVLPPALVPVPPTISRELLRRQGVIYQQYPRGDWVLR